MWRLSLSLSLSAWVRNNKDDVGKKGKDRDWEGCSLSSREMIRHNGLEWNANFETVKGERKYHLPYHEIQSTYRSPPSLSLPTSETLHCGV